MMRIKFQESDEIQTVRMRDVDPRSTSLFQTAQPIATRIRQNLATTIVGILSILQVVPGLYHHREFYYRRYVHS